MASPRAIFFDMDGTILDWQTGMEERWRAACERGCAGSPALDADALLAAVHEKREWFWRDPARAAEGGMDLDAASRAIVAEALVSLGAASPDLAASIAGGSALTLFFLEEPEPLQLQPVVSASPWGGPGLGLTASIRL
jgi:hypothetical protein